MSQFEQFKEQINNQPQVQAAKSWYLALPSRDQLVVKSLAVFVAIAMIILVVYAPMIKQQQRLENKLERTLATYNKIADNAHKFGGVHGSANGPILSVVSQQARQQGITLSRYEQDGNGLRIWIDKVAFDEVITWLEELQASNGIRVAQINIDHKDNPGWVDLRATLTP